MEKKRKKKIVIPAKALFLALILLCVFLSLLMFFGYGFDVARQMVFYPLWVCGLPLFFPFLVFLVLEIFTPKADLGPAYRPNGYRLILWISFGAEILSLLLGGILLVLHLNGVLTDENPNFPLLLESLLIVPGEFVYLALNLIFAIRNKSKKGAFLFTVPALLCLAGFLVGTICMRSLGFGWALFYLGAPMGLLFAATYGKDSLGETV